MELNPDREERGRAKVVPRLPGAYRTRREAAEYLQSRGYPISFSTLTKLCALGEGPEPAAWWGSRPIYTEQALDAWAEARSRPTKVCAVNETTGHVLMQRQTGESVAQPGPPTESPGGHGREKASPTEARKRGSDRVRHRDESG